LSLDHIDQQEVSKKLRAAAISVFAALALVALKLGGAVFTNSLALFSEAGHSFVDGVAAIVTLIAVWMARVPPDREHHFGHAKYESVGALVQLIILLALCGFIIFEAIERLRMNTPPVVRSGFALGVMVVSIGVEAWRTMSLFRAARHSKSEALAASSIHFLSDFLDSIAVIIGLIFALFGYARADSYAALIVAAVILTLSVRLGRDVLHSLTDRAPAGLADDIRPIVCSVAHVMDVHDIRIRRAGAQYFAEMHVDLEPDLPLAEAHNVLDIVEDELRKRYPNMHITTHPEPYQPGTA